MLLAVLVVDVNPQNAMYVTRLPTDPVGFYNAVKAERRGSNRCVPTLRPFYIISILVCSTCYQSCERSYPDRRRFTYSSLRCLQAQGVLYPVLKKGGRTNELTTVIKILWAWICMILFLHYMPVHYNIYTYSEYSEYVMWWWNVKITLIVSMIHM